MGRTRVARFIDDIVLPAEASIGTRPFFDIVRELQVIARERGLWCPFIPTEWGGMGLGHLANAIVQIEIGRAFSHLGAWAMNCMGPQDATMVRKRWLARLPTATRSCWAELKHM